ncbi:MAG: DUF748 domain-containing protein, partial [Burkholderiales bacterium]|nr:DUF748 domain-containing protein [Burkholderiales bacterium]
MRWFGKKKPAAATPAKGDGASTPSQADARWVRFRRWFSRAVIVGLALILLLRLALVFIVPAVIHRAAGHYGLDARFERMELNVMGTDAGLWHLTILPKEGGDPLATIEYVRADIATLSLLWGKLHIHRAETEGVELQLKRTADGRLPLVDRIISSLPQGKPQSSSSEFELSPPLRIDALRLSNLKVVFTDAAAIPEVASNVRLNLSLSDLDSPQRPMRFMTELRAEPILDYLLVEGEGRTTPQQLDVEMNVQVRGLKPHAVTGYLALLGLSPQARQLDMQMTGGAHIQVVQPAQGGQAGGRAARQHSPAVQGQIVLNDIALTADEKEVAALDQMTIDISTLSGDLANCTAMSVKGVRLEAMRTAQDVLRIGGVELGAAQPAVMPDDNTPATQPAVASSAAPAASQPATTFYWRLGELDVADVSLKFRDDLIEPGTELALLLDSLTIHNLSNRPVDVDTTVDLKGSARAPGMAGAISLTGSLQPFKTPLGLDADLHVQHIRPDAIKPYLAAAGLESLIEDGSLKLKLQSQWTPRPQGELLAGLTIQQVELTDGRPLLKLDKVVIDELHLQPAIGQAAVGEVRIEGTRLHATREPDGAIRTLGLRTRTPAAPAAPP